MPKRKPRIEVRHISSAPLQHDDYQVLVERVWPRGINKEDVRLDHWLKDLAPSTALRRWMSQHPQRFDEFRARYISELRRDAAWTVLAKVLDDRPVVLLYSAGDQRYNHAVILKEFIEEQMAAGREARMDIAKDQPTTGGNPPGTVGPPRRTNRQRSTKAQPRSAAEKRQQR